MTGSPTLPPELWMDHVVIDQRRVAEAFLREELEPQERNKFALHLQHCEECKDRVTLAQLWVLSRDTRKEIQGEMRVEDRASEPGTTRPAEKAGTERPQERRPDEPLVTRVVVRPEEGATDRNFGEILAKRLETQNTVTANREPTQTESVRGMPSAEEILRRAAEQPTLRSQFETWQLVILGVLLGLFLMAIPAAYLLVQVRRQVH